MYASGTFVTPEVHEVALTLMEGLSCPRSLTVAILLRYNEAEQLVKLECNPRDYLAAGDVFSAMAATNFLRKVTTTIPGIDPVKTAIEKWKWSEAECFKANRRLYELVDSGITMFNGTPVNPSLAGFIRQVRRNLRRLIGERPPSDSDIRGVFGPGATMSDSARRCTLLHKLSSVPTLTPSALGFLFPWTGTKWASACAETGQVPSFVRGNSFFTVDKTALTKRACAKEPSLNAYYQRGFGLILARRIARQGFDLETGKYVHMQVACSASKSGEYSTIDLTSASDTMSIALVKLLLPNEWFYLLDSLRSHFTFFEGKWIRLEKFSSMGNGFTFELETAIFIAICQAATRGDPRLFVYGDDIIVPTEFSSDVIAALKFFGFTPNTSKTFVDGAFRESCGGDFFNGMAVRSHYIKELPNEPQDYIALANGIRRLIIRDKAFGSRNGLLRAWFKCLDVIPTSIRQCRGPEVLGDIVIHDEEKFWRCRWRSSIRYVKVYRPARFKRIWFGRFHPDVQFAAALYGVTLFPMPNARRFKGSEDPRGVNVRDGVEGYKVGWTPYS